MKKIKKFNNYNKINEFVQNNGLNELDGFIDPEANKIKREDKTWSDSDEFYDVKSFDRLVCRNCGNKTFEVLAVPELYETSAQCSNCGMYYIVHTG